MTVLTSIKSDRKWLKTLIAQIIMAVLGRAFQVYSEKDPAIKKEIAQWPEDFKLELNVMPMGPKQTIQKKNGKIHAKRSDDKAPDLSVSFKNIESAFLLLAPIMGVPQGFAERRFIVIGDVAKAMSFTRCLNVILAYLYPDFLCRNLMKRVPEMNVVQRMAGRVYFYMIGIITG